MKKWVIIRQNACAVTAVGYSGIGLCDYMPRHVQDAEMIADACKKDHVQLDYAPKALQVVESDTPPVPQWGEGVFEVDEETGRIGDLYDALWDES